MYRPLRAISGNVLVTFLVLIAAFVVLEEAAIQFSSHHIAGMQRLDGQISLHGDIPYLSAGVGALAVILALFFTTVGVIATTAYGDVRATVRDRFISNRTNLVYTNLVVAGLVIGLGLLIVQFAGYRPHLVTVYAFSLLTLMSVLGLAGLTRALFYLLDAAYLSRTLPPRFRRVLRLAEARRRLPDELLAERLQLECALILRAYRDLIAVMEQGSRRRGLEGGRQVVRDLLELWSHYAASKGRIPTGSGWFERIPQHPNWLTMGSTQLNLALQTQTGVAPLLIPDPIWVEKELATSVTRLLRLLRRTGDWKGAIQAADLANNVGLGLAEAFQGEEFALLHRAVMDGLT